MTLLIPIELIFKIMIFCDPKTLLKFGLISKIFYNDIKKHYKKYSLHFKRKYPYIFRQNFNNPTIFFNNCLLAYLQDLGFPQPKMKYIDKKPNKEYFNIIKKQIILKKMGFSSYESNNCAKTYKNIDKIITLKKWDIGDSYCKIGIELSENQINNVILLKKAGFMDHYIFEAVNIFNNVEKLIYLKRKNFWDSYCIEICQKFKCVDDLLKLKKAGFQDGICIKICNMFKNFEKVLTLKKNGFNDSYSLEGALYFDDLSKIISLKQSGFRDYFSILYSKYISEKELESLKDLKNQGYSDVECGELLRIEFV